MTPHNQNMLKQVDYDIKHIFTYQLSRRHSCPLPSIQQQEPKLVHCPGSLQESVGHCLPPYDGSDCKIDNNYMKDKSETVCKVGRYIK